MSSSGSEFQTVGPAIENARRPYVLRRQRGTMSWCRFAERRRSREATSEDVMRWSARLGLYHDGDSNENVKKPDGVLLRNRQIHDIVGQISPSYVFGRHGLWPSSSNPARYTDQQTQQIAYQPVEVKINHFTKLFARRQDYIVGGVVILKSCQSFKVKLKLKPNKALDENSSLSYGTSPAIWDHSVTCHLNPSQ